MRNKTLLPSRYSNFSPAAAAADAVETKEMQRQPHQLCVSSQQVADEALSNIHTAEEKYDSWSHILAVRWEERSCVSCKENIKIARYILFTPNSKEVKMAPNTTDKEIKR